MITYSRQEMERQLVADQAFWRRVPGTATAILWPLEVILLGWDVGAWAGLATVVLLSFGSVVAPPRLKVSIYLVDLLEQPFRLPLDLCWLLMVWQLWLRDPRFGLLGQPLVGAVVATLVLWLITRLAAYVVRLAARRLVPSGQR